jgi:hypothetical protein
MPRVAIYGMAIPAGCRGKKRCAVVSNIDRLKPVYSQEVDDNHGDKKAIKFKVPKPGTSNKNSYYDW